MVRTVTKPVPYIITSAGTFSPRYNKYCHTTHPRIEHIRTGFCNNTIRFDTCDVLESQLHIRAVQRREIALVAHNTLASKCCVGYPYLTLRYVQDYYLRSFGIMTSWYLAGTMLFM